MFRFAGKTTARRGLSVSALFERDGSASGDSHLVVAAAVTHLEHQEQAILVHLAG